PSGLVQTPLQQSLAIVHALPLGKQPGVVVADGVGKVPAISRSGAPQPEANRAKRAAATAAQSRAHMTHPRRCCRSAFTGVDEALAAAVDTAIARGRRAALADHALTLTPSGACWFGARGALCSTILRVVTANLRSP